MNFFRYQFYQIDGSKYKYYDRATPYCRPINSKSKKRTKGTIHGQMSPHNDSIF